MYYDIDESWNLQLFARDGSSLSSSPSTRSCTFCRNPGLGLVTKARGCKVAGQKGHPEIISHVPGSAKSVQEWTFTLPSELPCWELESQMDSRIFRARLHGSKLISLNNFFISLESYWNVDIYNGLALPIWTFVTQVMARRKVGSQIGTLTPDH
jgi:hypothetical protein